MGYDHFCKWLRVQFSFHKVLVLFSKKMSSKQDFLFAKGFFPNVDLENTIFFLQRPSFQISHPFCNGFFKEFVLFTKDFLNVESSFWQRNQ